jgi:hypothetical protein
MAQKLDNDLALGPVSADAPEPLTPSDCDLRGEPPPRDIFIALAVREFGISVAEATAMVDEVIARDRAH